MVIVMSRTIFQATALAILTVCAANAAEAAPDAGAQSRAAAVASVAHRSMPPSAGHLRGGLLLVRDIRSASGNGNGCWNACFTDFDECMGVRQKAMCVSRVKTCLETCDRLSNRPGM